MELLKCYACDGIFEENTLIYTKDPDELMCPLCGAREPGFEPLSEEQAEVFEKYKAVDRVLYELGVNCAYDMPSFWTKGNQFKVIPTKYHKGYMQALEDVETEIRKRFGFAEREKETKHE